MKPTTWTIDPMSQACDAEWHEFLNTRFKEKGLGEWKFDQTPKLIGTVNVINFGTVLFADKKDQFRFELLGGESWRVQMFLEWLSIRRQP